MRDGALVTAGIHSIRCSLSRSLRDGYRAASERGSIRKSLIAETGIDDRPLRVPDLRSARNASAVGSSRPLQPEGRLIRRGTQNRRGDWWHWGITEAVGLNTKWRITRHARDKLHHRLSFVFPNPSFEMALG